MGLDQFFYATKSSKFDYDVAEELAYFRKFNALNRFILVNTNSPLDLNDVVEVPMEVFDKLYDIVNKLLTAYNACPIKAERMARTLLPTQSGFFFGSVDYDEYYWNDLVRLKESLEALFKRAEEIKDEHYWYESNW